MQLTLRLKPPVPSRHTQKKVQALQTAQVPKTGLAPPPASDSVLDLTRPPPLTAIFATVSSAWSIAFQSAGHDWCIRS